MCIKWYFLLKGKRNIAVHESLHRGKKKKKEKFSSVLLILCSLKNHGLYIVFFNCFKDVGLEQAQCLEQ